MNLFTKKRSVVIIIILEIPTVHMTHDICVVFFTLFLIFITHLFILLLVPHNCFNYVVRIVLFSLHFMYIFNIKINIVYKITQLPQYYHESKPSSVVPPRCGTPPYSQVVLV